MTIERYSETIPQTPTGQQLPLERSTGNFFLLLNSANLVKVTLMYDGSREEFANVTAGVYIRRVRPWTNLRIDGPIGTPVSFYFGAAPNTLSDETDIRLQLAQLTGVTLVADQPGAGINDNAPVALPTAQQTTVFPANLTRRRMKVSFASNAAIPPATVFFRKVGAANNLMEVQPGAVYPFDGTYGMDVRNDSGGALSAMIFEEA